MKPKQRRDRLFKFSRPNIREVTLIDENGYTKDMGILWGAYGNNMGATQKEFADIMTEELKAHDKSWLVEDKNASYENGYGAVGLLYGQYDGWELTPTFDIFEWATPRNTLRAVVSFLQMMRYNKDIGIVSVHSPSKTKRFFNHIQKYGVLKYVAKLPNGNADGDRYMYYLRGRK